MNIYRQGVYAVDPGACNISGLINSLPEIAGAIETELGIRDHIAAGWIAGAKQAVRAAWDNTNSSVMVNSDHDVGYHVVHMAHLAYCDNTTSPVFAHPVMRLLVDQMAMLANKYSYSDHPDIHDHFSKFGNALDICRARMNE